MPGLRQVLLVAMILAAAPSIQSQTPQKVDTVYVRDTVVVRDTVAPKRTTYLLDTSSAVQKEVAELKGEFYEKALDALDRQDSSLGIVFGVIGILLLIVGAMGAYASFTVYKARETVDREIEKIRDQRTVMDKIVQSAETDYGHLGQLMKAADSSAKVADAVAPASADVKKPKPFEDRIKLIEEADATKAVDLYEQLRFDLKVAGHQDSIIPSSLRRNIGFSYYRLKRYEKALAELVEYLKDSPEDEGALFAAGFCCSRLENPKEALKYWERVATVNPSNVAALHNAGRALVAIFDDSNEMKWIQLALKKFEQATTLKNDIHESFLGWGAACYRMYTATKDHKWLILAIEKNERAITINGNYHEAFNNLVTTLIKLYHERGDKASLNDAVAKSKRAVEIAPDHKDYNYNLACALALLDKKGDMLAALKAAVDYDPKYMKMAREDEDFKAYWNDADFIALTAEEPPKDSDKKA